jgi:hypothetical protein
VNDETVLEGGDVSAALRGDDGLVWDRVGDPEVFGPDAQDVVDLKRVLFLLFVFGYDLVPGFSWSSW